MIEFSLPVAIEPVEWTVVFHRKASSRWFALIAMGHFKHVSAFAYAAGPNVWVIHDWQFGGLRVAVLPHSDDACRLIASLFGGPDTEWMPVRRRPSATGFRLGTCVGAVKHLLGLRTWALRPDALYRSLSVSGAIPAHQHRSPSRPRWWQKFAPRCSSMLRIDRRENPAG